MFLVRSVCLLRHVSQRVSLIVIPGFLFLSLFVCLFVASHLSESKHYCHSRMFVCLDVCPSATYSLPQVIDHNQIWYAGLCRYIPDLGPM